MNLNFGPTKSCDWRNGTGSRPKSFSLFKPFLGFSSPSFFSLKMGNGARERREKARKTRADPFFASSPMRSRGQRCQVLPFALFRVFRGPSTPDLGLERTEVDANAEKTIGGQRGAAPGGASGPRQRAVLHLGPEIRTPLIAREPDRSKLRGQAGAGSRLEIKHAGKPMPRKG